MAADSGLQDAVEKGREAFRRSMPDGHEPSTPPRRLEERIPAQAELHPFFRGLLETLPEIGSDWASAERQQWLETARNIFALLYREPAPEREPVPFTPRTLTPPLAEQRSA